jgi:PAS domain S-box-containing protein
MLQKDLANLRHQSQNDAIDKKSLFADLDRRKQPAGSVSPDKGLLRCIIDSVSDLIYVKDQHGVYRGCNKASEQFVGLKESEQIGKTDFDFFERELAETIQATDRQVLTTGAEHCIEEWVPSPDGGSILLESKKKPFYGPDGTAEGIVGISRNITLRKQAEEALLKANRELDAFARTVAHDLRSPLTPIIGYAEILRDHYHERLDERALGYLEEIISSGEEMLTLMKDLLSLAMSGQIERPSKPFNTRHIVEKVVQGLTEQLNNAGLTVKIGAMPNLRIPKTLLIQVFDNLILNAMKYGSKKGDIIEVGGERSGDRVTLFVRDHGPGISACERERIFELFYRGATNEEIQGTGIGLATIQKIAGFFDGKAWVEETPGGGSTFKVNILDIPAEKTTER